MERYGDMLSVIKYRSEDVLLDKKSIFPGPGSMDICVRQSIENKIPPKRVDPVYVREFVPFGR